MYCFDSCNMGLPMVIYAKSLDQRGGSCTHESVPEAVVSYYCQVFSKCQGRLNVARGFSKSQCELYPLI